MRSPWGMNTFLACVATASSSAPFYPVTPRRTSLMTYELGLCLDCKATTRSTSGWSKDPMLLSRLTSLCPHLQTLLFYETRHGGNGDILLSLFSLLSPALPIR